ncbi:hypothetical protein [Ottowia thiooxydans]|uniref:hypothetical protein n=1 Tax=Ottowia thiooxydans TaxID=219182 RepID=UPI00048EACCE|nr:hypothetical protein [Ottowia thiooxydans]
MPIGLIDFPNTRLQGVSPLSFAEPASLNEFDLVIWRPAAIANVYSRDHSFEGTPVLDVRDSQRVFSHIRYWRTEFEEFLGRGGTLVMLAPGFTKMGLHTVQDVVPFDVIEALPGYRSLGHQACEPSALRCDAGEPFRQFFDAFSEQFVACATLTPGEAQAIASVSDSDGVCAVYEYHHPGRILVIPELRETASPAALATIVDALDDLSARLRLDARVSGYVGARPVVTERERALRQQLAQTSQERRELQSREAALLKEISDIAFFGQLEHGDRVGVINAALQVLHALGAYVQHGIGSTGTLVFEHLGHACVLVLLEEADLTSAKEITETLSERAQPWANELNREVAPIAFIAGANAENIMRLATAKSTNAAVISWLTGATLQIAYKERNFDFLDEVREQDAALTHPARP